MSRKLKFKTQLALAIEPARPAPEPIPLCEVEYCLSEGRFACTAPGWENLKNRAKERRYFCREHRPE